MSIVGGYLSFLIVKQNLWISYVWISSGGFKLKRPFREGII
jgi:hypothetical protein